MMSIIRGFRIGLVTAAAFAGLLYAALMAGGSTPATAQFQIGDGPRIGGGKSTTDRPTARPRGDRDDRGRRERGGGGGGIGVGIDIGTTIIDNAMREGGRRQ